MKVWRRANLVLIPFAACLPACTVLAAGALAAGHPAAPTPAAILGRVVLALWGVTLLVFGRRLPRATAGTFFLVLGLAVAWPLLAGVHYLAALAGAYLVFALGMAAFCLAPRLGTAVAMVWPFAAVYGLFLFASGGFRVNFWLLGGLSVAGLAAGAVFPRFSLAILAPALGVALTALAWGEEPSFWPWVLCFGLGVLWQGAFLPFAVPGASDWPTAPRERLRLRRRMLGGAMKGGAAVLAGGFLLLALLAPQPAAQGEPYARRMETLRRDGVLGRPGFLLSSSDALYCFGRPLAVALVSARPGLLQRLLVLVAGRSPARAVHALRAVKDPDELARMRRAAEITAKAFSDAAPLVRPGANERDIETAVLGCFRNNGATGLAFPCLVGSGRNATFPHYMANDATLEDGFVVVDIGCSVDGYAADMTRTFPVTGAYTPEQRRLIELVAKAQQKARQALKPGVRFAEVDQAARDVIKAAGFGPYFNHYIGHPVGLDVHDPFVTGPVKPGMVMTLEPGVYIPHGAPVDRAYWDLGVRIEDDFLVTETGCEPLVPCPAIPVPVDTHAPASGPA